MNFMRLLFPIKPPTFSKIFAVCSSSGQHPVKFLESQNHYRQKDDVSQRYQLIYKAPMDQILNYTSAYLTLSSATIGVFGAYYAAFVYEREMFNAPVVIGDDVVIASSGKECLVYLGAFFIFHAAVKVLLSKFVIRLYKDGDSYIAVYRGMWVNSIKKHQFQAKDVKKLNPTLVVTWGDARYDLGNRHGIILENYFKTPEYFNKFVCRTNEEDGEKND